MRGAGGGRPRKPAGQTRHRNPTTKKPVTIKADAKVDQIPKPAIAFKGVRKKIWDQMWAQPVATLWDVADVAVLTRLVVLQTTPAVYQDRGLLAETRQLEDRFLLNPYARAQQRIIIEDAAGEGEEAGDVTWLEDARRRLHGPE